MRQILFNVYIYIYSSSLVSKMFIICSQLSNFKTKRSVQQYKCICVYVLNALTVLVYPCALANREKNSSTHVQTILTTPVDVLPIPDSTPVVFLGDPTIARSVLPFFAEVTLYSFLPFPDRLFAPNTQRILDRHNLTEIAMREL